MSQTTDPVTGMSVRVLDHKLTLYIPDGVFQQSTIEGLAALAGGATITRGVGIWMPPRGPMGLRDDAVVEPVTLVEVWLTEAEVTGPLQRMLGDIGQYLQHRGEKAFMYTLNSIASVITF